MKNLTLFLLLIALFFLSACQKERLDPANTDDNKASLAADADFSSGPFSIAEGSSGESSGAGNGQGEPGLITAGEWQDQEHWDFWQSLLASEEYKNQPSYWGFYLNNRIAVMVKDMVGNPAANVKVDLFQNGEKVWSAKTDNLGKAELWIGWEDPMEVVDLSDYYLMINELQTVANLRVFSEGVNEVVLNNVAPFSNRVELAFIVDATGSMNDEIAFLKKDLEDVIKTVETKNNRLNIHTAAVFYRDQGDEYLTKVSEFSDELQTTVDFIEQQNSGGGGDFPEAVHDALEAGIQQLEWSESAKTRIAFLLLDAPPHYEPAILNQLRQSIQTAAAAGIKIIPITASGIDKNTEFLMRFFALSTNGTYVFITDDSGIGNAHLEPSVGDFEVEFLNELMVRLIERYTE